MKFLLVKHEGKECLATQTEWGEGPEIEIVAQFFQPHVEWEFIKALVDLLNKHANELEE
jgi:hypothetical protein